ncbi:hypothetical protein LCGC14_2078750 [marine sediment metagenome]|uniref:Uncharacterized protein n=1 Tax=marine sediment metagenome TaxID=412755 RepID=A0A0F9GUL3_9ZZZZ
MATPTSKSPKMEELLEENFGRTTAIESGQCVPEPVGCGKSIGDFKDDQSEKEYRISGLCQICQDDVFGN